ncbi:MAG: histidine kinase [Anaerolineae bacterium]
MRNRAPRLCERKEVMAEIPLPSIQPMLDAISAQIAVLDSTGTILGVNAAWRRSADLNGLAWSDYGIGHNYLDACEPAAGAPDKGALEAGTGIAGVLAHLRDEFSLEYACHSPTEQRWFILRAMHLPGLEPICALVVHEEITRQKQSEAEIRAQRDLLYSTIESLNHPFYVINAQDHRIDMANSAARNQSLNPEATTCYAFAYGLTHPCKETHHICTMEEVKRTNRPVVFERELADAQGNHRYVEVHGYPLFDGDGQVEKVIEYAFDITQRKEAEESLLQAAATAERDRLARELHDAVTQTLFSASLLAEAVPHLWKDRPEAAEKGLGELRALTKGALAEMRTLLLELRPAGLVEKPLDDLLGQLTHSMGNRIRAPITLDVDGHGRLPPGVQTTLYRITQEALNNVAKHANAGQVSVILDWRPGGATLSIHDDGVGFDPENILPDRMGLSIMYERADRIGATLQVDSKPGQGTQIRVEWQA